MTIKWSKKMQKSLDQMMESLRKTREVLSAKVSRCKKPCGAEGHPENSGA
jgi:hypothetical protein